MMQLLVPFLAALLGGLLLTPLVRAFARRVGMVAAPRSDRWHRQPTALLGGIAIFGGFVLGAITLLLRVPLLSIGSVVGILGAAVIMFGTGLVDDRIKLRPASKLVMQVVAAVCLTAAGAVYQVTPWSATNVMLTVLWFLALTNSLNLLDNMDGVSAGVAAIAAGVLAAIFALQGHPALAGICLALAGATLGFLPYNFHPASIFMGDSGSLFLGAMLAGLGALVPGESGTRDLIPVLFAPAFIVAIPILDTLLVTTTRTLAGRPVSVGGRDHTTHRLVALGLSERQTALLLYGCAVTGGLFAIALSDGEHGLGVVGVLFLIVLALGAAYLGRLRVYSSSEAPPPRVTVLVSDLLYKKRALEFILDVVLFGTCYYLAYLLRWDFALPPTQAAAFERTLGAVIGSYAAAFGILGVYRDEWHRISLSDAHRIARATVVGLGLSCCALLLLFRSEEFARSAVVLTALLVFMFTTTARLTFRSADLVRRKWRRDGARTLIYGAGARGEIAARELLANAAQGMLPVGFIDDDPFKKARVILGIPVLGAGSDLPALIRQQRVDCVLLACSQLSAQRLDVMHEAAARANVPVYHFTFAFHSISATPARRVGSARIALE